MTGRRPKPTALKKARGNPGKRKLSGDEPQPLPSLPECPKHLDREARAEWRRITPQLLKLKILAEIDRAALAGYCMAWSRWIRAEMNLRKRGLVIMTRTLYPIPNPYLGIANTALDMMRKFGVEFGMTPSSKSRVHAAQAPDGQSDDPWDRLDSPADSSRSSKSVKVN